MRLPAEEQLESLSRGELIALVNELIGAVEQLQAEVAKLKAQLAKDQPPSANSRNSSQPPSRDQKANLPTRRRKRLGARPGHQPAIRQLVDDPDQVIEAPVRQCTQCRADLRQVEPRAVVRRQVTELPMIRPLVIETRQHEVICPACQSVERGLLPEGLGAGRVFGPRLENTRPSRTRRPTDTSSLPGKLEDFSRRHALDNLDDLFRAVDGHTLHQKMNVIFVSADFYKLNLVPLLNFATDLFQFGIDLCREDPASVFRWTNDVIEQNRNIVVLVNELAHSRMIKPQQAAGN